MDFRMRRKLNVAMEAKDVKQITDCLRQRSSENLDDTAFALITEGCRMASLECWDDLVSSDSRRTLLLAAVRRGNADQVRMLLMISQSAWKDFTSNNTVFDINSQDDFGIGGRTLVHEAAEAGHANVIEALVEAGARVNAMADLNCLQPIHLAVSNGHEEAADALRRAGATENAVSDLCRPAIESAIRRAALAGDAQLVRTIAKAHQHVDDDSLPLAAEQGHRSVVQALLECGAKVNQSDFEGFTALHHAARRGDSQTMRLLFAYGAAPAVHATNDGKLQFPLHLAANGRIVEMLLAHGAVVDQRAWMGHTALHTAVNDGRADAAMALVDAGADQSIPNPTRREKAKEDRCAEKQWLRRWLSGCAPRRTKTEHNRAPERHDNGLQAVLRITRF